MINCFTALRGGISWLFEGSNIHQWPSHNYSNLSRDCTKQAPWLPVLLYSCLFIFTKSTQIHKYTNTDSSPRSWIIKMPRTKKIEERNIKGRPCTYYFSLRLVYLRDSCAGIVEYSVGAKNRLWHRVSYRPVRLHRPAGRYNNPMPDYSRTYSFLQFNALPKHVLSPESTVYQIENTVGWFLFGRFMWRYC